MLKKLVLPLLAAAGVLYYSCNPTNPNTLVLGTMSGWPPFVSITPQGTYEGYDIAIANRIARALNKELVIKDMDTAMLINSLDQGGVDFIMTGLDITPERAQKMIMIPYQGEPIIEYPLIFWKDIPEGLQSLEDLKSLPNAIISVEAGSSQEEVLKNYSGFTIKNLDPLTSLLELKNGRITASFLDMKMCQRIMEKEPKLKALMMRLPKDQVINGCGIGIKKGNSALAGKIQALITDLKQSGELKALERAWFGVRS